VSAGAGFESAPVTTGAAESDATELMANGVTELLAATSSL